MNINRHFIQFARIGETFFFFFARCLYSAALRWFCAVVAVFAAFVVINSVVAAVVVIVTFSLSFFFRSLALTSIRNYPGLFTQYQYPIFESQQQLYIVILYSAYVPFIIKDE